MMETEQRAKLRGIVKSLVHGEMPLLEHFLTHRVMLMLDVVDDVRTDSEPLAWAVSYTRTVTGEKATDFYQTYSDALLAESDLQRADPPMEPTLTPLYTHTMQPNARNQRPA